MTEPVVTLADVEHKMITLAKEQRESFHELEEVEMRLAKAQTAREIDLPKARHTIRQRALAAGRKITVGEVEDQAVIECELIVTEYNLAEALVRVARAKQRMLDTQIGIARSVNASVRSAMELS